jgi:hypothetical protein
MQDAVNLTNNTNYQNLDSKVEEFLYRWTNTQSVTGMRGMFQNASKFNNGGSPSISGWNVSNVTRMYDMFNTTPLFNQPLNAWNVGKVTDIFAMFSSASSFNQPIGDWNITGVTNTYGFINFMAGKTSANYSTTNYDDILTKWSAKNVKTGLTLNMGSVGTGIKYTIAGQPGKSILTGSTGSGGKGWTITDGGI